MSASTNNPESTDNQTIGCLPRFSPGVTRFGLLIPTKLLYSNNALAALWQTKVAERRMTVLSACLST